MNDLPPSLADFGYDFNQIFIILLRKDVDQYLVGQKANRCHVFFAQTRIEWVVEERRSQKRAKLVTKTKSRILTIEKVADTLIVVVIQVAITLRKVEEFSSKSEEEVSMKVKIAEIITLHLAILLRVLEEVQEVVIPTTETLTVMALEDAHLASPTE